MEIVWRILCGLAITSGLGWMAGIFPELPVAWQVVSMAPLMVVGLLIVVAEYAVNRVVFDGG